MGNQKDQRALVSPVEFCPSASEPGGTGLAYVLAETNGAINFGVVKSPRTNTVGRSVYTCPLRVWVCWGVLYVSVYGQS